MGKFGATNREVELGGFPLATLKKSKQKVQNPLCVEGMQRMPYIGDPTIVPRVQKYLEANVHRRFININLMADDLQRTYPDYGKRKKSAFRGLVKKAYGIVVKNYSMNDQGSSSEEEVSDDIPEDELSMGNSRGPMQGHFLDVVSEQPDELIDISSDENEGESGPALSEKPLNGPPMMSKSSRHPLLPTPEVVIRNIGHPLMKNQNQNSPSVVEKPASTSSSGSRKRKMDSTNAGGQHSSKKKKTVVPEKQTIKFDDVAGMHEILRQISEMMMCIRNPEVWTENGVDPPKGFLLHGPPGCGKTLLVHAIAGEFDVPLIKVSAPELVAGVSGESEERIRELFDRALMTTPCILFIDEIDAITQNRQNASKDMEKRIVSQLLTCMDDLSTKEGGHQVVVIGATNRPTTIDPALRRSGRFDKEICVGIPDGPTRYDILKLLTSKCKLSEDVNLETLAKNIPGYVGADISNLIRESVVTAIGRLFNELQELKKLEEAIAINNMKNQQQQQQNQQKETPISDDGDKSDPEIIVDGDSKDKPDEEKRDEQNTNDSAVVVIDDDVKEPAGNLNLNNVGGGGDANVNNVEPKVEEGSINTNTNVLPISQIRTPLDEIRLFNDITITKEQIANMTITMNDFEEAIKKIQPSAKREGFATVPDVTWDDVGSLSSIREELQMDILGPIRYPQHFESLGLTTPAGILLCGPPGCGKTLLAKAIANEVGINFISVNGPELLNMYVGESERAVRICFERARNSAPCVIFFDELDSLCPKRSDSNENAATSRVVNQMLTEMDGVKARKHVYLLAASNRPDIIDPAVLRPGRLDKILYVGIPAPADRVEILRTITKNGTKPLLAPDVDLEVIGKLEQCQGYTGADLAALVKEASRECFKDLVKEGNMEKQCLVTNEHFNRAVLKVKPSVSEKDQKTYERLKKLYSVNKDVEEMEYS